MDFPHELILRDVNRTNGLDNYIEEKVAKLTSFSDKILASRVIIDGPSAHHRKGGHFRVTVEVSIPGADLVANRDTKDAKEHESMHLALKDAFSAMRRQLLEHTAKKRARHVIPKIVAAEEDEEIEETTEIDAEEVG